MKKTAFLPVFALAGLVSQVWAADYTDCTGEYKGYCSWGPEECYSINKGKGDTEDCAEEYDNCFKNGYIYDDKDCTEWSGKGNDPSFTVIYCQWTAKCEKVKSQDEKEHCEETNGTLYSDDKCTDRIGGKDPSTALGCCKWDTETNCWTIWEGLDPEDNKDGTEKVRDCNRGKNVFWNGACPTTSVGACPQSTPAYDGRNSSSSGAGNSSSSAAATPSSSSAGTGGSSSSTTTSGNSSSSGTTAGGSSSSGTVMGNSSSSGAVGSSFAYCIKDGTCLEGPFTLSECVDVVKGSPSNSCSSPIILRKLVHSNALNAMQNAVNLQITGSAAVQIFDLKGNAVRALKFEQGNYIVPLSDLPHGLYIVKASSASWKQTIKATVR